MATDEVPDTAFLSLEIDGGGMGLVWRVKLGNVTIWSHAAIEGPWPDADSLLRALWPDRMADPFAAAAELEAAIEAERAEQTAPKGDVDNVR